MDAIGYIRVSKDEEHKESPAVQRKKIQEFCKAKGYTLKRFYEDIGISGAKVEKRPSMLKLKHEVEQKACDVVVARYSDRLFRNSTEADGFADLCLQKKVLLEFVDGSYNWQEHSSRLLYRFKAGIDQYIREHIGKTTKESKMLLAEERGDPAGRKPWGRTFSKAEGWGLDQEKARLIRQIAKRFLKGESLKAIAAENRELAKAKPDLYGGVAGYTSLLRVLKERSGPDWYRTFYNFYTKEVEKHIRIEVPELLDAATRKAILEKVQDNRTWNGERKHRYLLKGHIFCFHCGSPLTGETYKRHSYYRHKWHKERCPDHFFNSIRADAIEEETVLELFRAFGDKARIEAARKAALPDPTERQALLKERASYEKDLLKTEQQIDRAMELLLDDKMDKALFTAKADKLKASLAQMRQELAKVDERLALIPEVPNNFDRMQAGLKARWFKSLNHLKSMTYDELREMIKTLLGGRDANGKRYGIYVKKPTGKAYLYEIRGALIPQKLTGVAPMDPDHKRRLMGHGDEDDVKRKVFKTAREHE